MEIQNSMELYSEEKAQMQVMLEEFPLEALLGHDLETIFSGLVETPTTAINRLFTVNLGDLNSLVMQIGFRGTDLDALTIRNLPFLSELGRELQNSEYSRIYVFSDRVEGELLRTLNETRIQGLKLEKKGSFIIQGDVIAKNNELSGTLQVGLPSSALFDPELHAGLRKIFTRQEGGYLWCEVKLSGQPSKPQDNFIQQLERAHQSNSPTSSSQPAPNDRELNIEDELEE
jgi:hypothetical protein